MGFLSCKGSADVERAELHLLPIAFRQHCPAPAVPPTRPPYLGTHWGAGAAGQFYVSSSPEEGTRRDRAEAFPTHTDKRTAVSHAGAARGRPPPCGGGTAQPTRGRAASSSRSSVPHRAVPCRTGNHRSWNWSRCRSSGRARRCWGRRRPPRAPAPHPPPAAAAAAASAPPAAQAAAPAAAAAAWTSPSWPRR